MIHHIGVRVSVYGDTQMLSAVQPLHKSPLNPVRLGVQSLPFTSLFPILLQEQGPEVLYFVCICSRDAEYKDVVILMKMTL